MKINELDYDLEIGKVIGEIKKEKARAVLLQFPDGLKPYAKETADEINEKLPDVRVLIWFGTCYGACDIPINLANKVDLVIQFGHNRFLKTKSWRGR